MSHIWSDESTSMNDAILKTSAETALSEKIVSDAGNMIGYIMKDEQTYCIRAAVCPSMTYAKIDSHLE